MTRTVRHVLMIALVLAGIAVMPIHAADAPELDGTYVSRGINPDGSQYSGLVYIVRNGDSFMVSWLTPSDRGQADGDRTLMEASQVGVGILSSDTLSVSFYAPHASGIVVYRIEENGRTLTGQWAVAGRDGAVHAETLTKLPPTGTAPEVETVSEPAARPRPAAVPMAFGLTL